MRDADCHTKPLRHRRKRRRHLPFQGRQGRETRRATAGRPYGGGGHRRGWRPRHPVCRARVCLMHMPPACADLIRTLSGAAKGSPLWGLPLAGPSDRVRTCGLMVPNHPRYQLRYTRIDMLLLWACCPVSSSPARHAPRRRKGIILHVCPRRKCFLCGTQGRREEGIRRGGACPRPLSDIGASRRAIRESPLRRTGDSDCHTKPLRHRRKRRRHTQDPFQGRQSALSSQ